MNNDRLAPGEYASEDIETTIKCNIRLLDKSVQVGEVTNKTKTKQKSVFKLQVFNHISVYTIIAT